MIKMTAQKWVALVLWSVIAFFAVVFFTNYDEIIKQPLPQTQVEDKKETQPKSKHIIKRAPVCATEELIDQLVMSLSEKDEKAWMYLMSNGCFTTKEPFPVSILDSNIWSGTARVRVYYDDKTVEVWTLAKAIE